MGKSSAQNGNHTRQQSKSPQHGPKQAIELGASEQVPARGSDAWAHDETHGLKSKVLGRKGFGNGCVGKQLVPDDLGGVGEASPRNYVPKEGDNLTKPELNHVQSTTWETSSYGDPDPRSLREIMRPKSLKSNPFGRVKIQITQGPV